MVVWDGVSWWGGVHSGGGWGAVRWVGGAVHGDVG